MNSLSRRRFLEQSMIATATSLALQSRLNAVQQPQNQDAFGPNETINVAVIGAGGRGKSHMEGFAGKNGAVVTHICDCDEKNGQQSCDSTAEKQNGKKPAWVRDIRKLLEDPSIHVVSIATPNHWHSLAAIMAIQAGKDVYVEKPVSHNVLEGRRVVQAARKHNRIVQTGTQCRSNPGMIDAIKAVHQGEIGEVLIARGLCYKPRGSIGPRGTYEVPKGIDYDLWSGPAPMLPVTRKNFHYDWHWQWPYGNGDLGNQGIHQMDLCRWALNENRLSERVFSYGARLGYEDAGDSANTQVVVHDYGKKQLIFEVRGLKTSSYRGASVGIVVEGSQGYLVMTSYDDGTIFDLDGKVVKKFSGGGDHFHYQNFVEAVRKRNYQLLNADIEQGHLSSALCHLGNISLRLGKQVHDSDVAAAIRAIDGKESVIESWNRTSEHLTENSVSNYSISVGPKLELNPTTEQFVGRDAPNDWLSREYRAPFTLPSEAAV